MAKINTSVCEKSECEKYNVFAPDSPWENRMCNIILWAVVHGKMEGDITESIDGLPVPKGCPNLSAHILLGE